MRIEKFLASSTLYKLFSAYNKIIGDFQKRLALEDVHFLQALILTGLFFEDRPLRPSELAKSLEISKSNLSHSLRGLEQLKLVERSISDEDARAYYFQLTREGKKKSAKLIKLFDSVENKIDAIPSAEKIQASLKSLAEIYERIKP